MCLAVPMRVLEIDGEKARVALSGIEIDVQLDLVEGVCVDDYVIVHAGFAIERLSAEEAKETLAVLRRVVE